MKRVKGLLAEVFPLVELTEVLIAIDGATGFSERLLHAANSRSPAMLVHLYAAILALSGSITRFGPWQPSCGARLLDLAWTAWRVGIIAE